LSWEIATIGTSSSLASSLICLENSETSTCRDSTFLLLVISWRQSTTVSFGSWRCLSRRALARISIIVVFGLSSMNIGAPETWPIYCPVTP
jgi:hypothetical protein